MTDATPFAGQVALVTGGGLGIGRATAIELGRQGAAVAVLSRQPTRIEAACAAVRAAGGQALGLPADVTQGAVWPPLLTLSAEPSPNGRARRRFPPAAASGRS